MSSFKLSGSIILASFFMAINVDPVNLSFLNYSSIRLLLPVLLLLPFLFLYYRHINISSIDISYILYLIIGLFFTINYQGLSYNLYWGVIAISFILFCSIYDNKAFLTNILFFILFVIFLVSFFVGVIDFLKLTNSFNFYDFNRGGSLIFLDNIMPRSSGMSRYCALLLLFIIFNEDYFIKNNFVRKLFIFIFCFLIIFFQSRTTILALCFTFTLIYFFRFKSYLPFINIYKYLLIFIGIIIILLIYKFFIHNLFFDINYPSALFIRDNFLDSSGRINLWLSSINAILNNNLLGLGFQSDRIFLNSNVSSAFFYSLMTTGIFFIFFLYVYFYFIFHHKLYSNLVLSVLLFLLFRSLFENSFSIYSVDFLVFYFFINHFKVKS